mmetsp:Transcript_44690/g.71523  ORF Transcript_44690/g.71523 Transcript_44690/m.71523 type:complete len:85 (+) Transcript_44690:1-255(+)
MKGGASADNKDDKSGSNEVYHEQIDLLRIVKWTEGHDEAWDWFWKVVVAVFSGGMTKKINEIKNEKNKKLPNKKEMENEDFSLF